VRDQIVQMTASDTFDFDVAPEESFPAKPFFKENQQLLN